jgi:hypothetical protein
VVFRMASLDETVRVAISVSNAERVKQTDTKIVHYKTGRRIPGNCYNCGKRGHFARDCRSKGKDDYPEGNGRARQAGSGRFGAPVIC